MTSLISKIKRRLNGAGIPEYPRVIYLVINGRCNLRCKMCDIGQRNQDAKFYKTMSSETDLSIEVMERIAQEIAGSGAAVHFNGTEPLLYRDLGKAIDAFTSRKIGCSLTTNGFLLREKADEIISNGIGEIYVSIDGPREIHDDIRGIDGAYERATRGLGHYLEKRDSGMKARCAMALSDINSDRLIDTLSNLKEIGVDSVVVSHLNFVTEEMAFLHNCNYADAFGSVDHSSISGVNPSKVDVQRLARDIRAAKASFGSFVSFEPNIDGSEITRYYKNPQHFVYSNRCLVARNSLQILSTGEVIPASRCFNKSMGSVLRQTVHDIWHGNKYQAFRSAIDDVKATPACTRCCGIFSAGRNTSADGNQSR
jgi:sulfatase maturation enzyme AslB (radical SAM superfamily)